MKISATQKNGLCKFGSPAEKGVINYGCSICNHHSEAIGSLTMPFIEKKTDTLSEEQITEMLVSAANEISIRLSYNRLQRELQN